MTFQNIININLYF